MEHNVKWLVLQHTQTIVDTWFHDAVTVLLSTAFTLPCILSVQNDEDCVWLSCDNWIENVGQNIWDSGDEV